MTATAPFVWLMVSLLLSLFFFGTEAVFLSSDKLKYAIGNKKPGATHYLFNTLFGHPTHFLATLVVGKIMALVMLVTCVLLLLESRFNDRITLSQALLLLPVLLTLILLTGYILPGLLRRHANFWMKLFLLPAFLFFVLFYPVTRFILLLSKLVVGIFGGRSTGPDGGQLGRKELDAFVQHSFHELGNEEDMDAEVKIFRNALDFSALKIKDCMVPRAEIVAVSVDTDVETLKEKFIETGLSRILVYRDDIDNILGYIHIWEIFSQPADWTASVTSISFVPESMSARQLMSDLMQQRKSIAVVVDEFGGTSGIVTMEDLVEEIFGEIEDEYDVKSDFIKREGEHAFVLSGRVEIDRLNELYHLGLPVSDAYSTVAGYLLHHTQRFPKTYETVVIGKYTFKILKVTARKIEVVRLQGGDSQAGR